MDLKFESVPGTEAHKFFSAADNQQEQKVDRTGTKELNS